MAIDMNRMDLGQFSGSDDLGKLRAAALHLRNTPGTILAIPPGRYILHDEQAHQLQADIMNGLLSNNPQDTMFSRDFQYAIGLDLTGAVDVAIEAYGVTFLVDGFMEPLSLQSCQRVKVSGLTIDHLRKPYSKGKIVACGDQYTDIRFDSQTYITAKMPSARISIIGEKSKLIEQVFSASEKSLVSENTVRFGGFSAAGHTGDEAYVWHTFHFRPAILIFESSDIVLQDVTINSQPGMGIVGHRSHNILLDGLKIVPGTGEKMSTNTDATHFTACTGLLRLAGCQFEGQGDDAINVHGYYHTIIKSSGRHCMTVVEVPTHCLKLDYPAAGDTLELSLISDLVPVDEYKVVKVTPDFANWCCDLELDHALPDQAGDYYLADVTQLPRLEFVNCFTRNHLARSVLVKTRNVLIENCLFESCTGTAIHVAAEGSWHEGVATDNLVIRNNRMVGCGKMGYGKIYDAGGISINILAGDPTVPVHKNILIENNIIDCSDSRYAIYAGNVAGLTIINNQLLSSQGSDNIRLAYCEDVDIRNNG